MWGMGRPTPVSSSAPSCSWHGTARPSRSSTERSTRSTTVGASLLGKVTATVASASPYTGKKASERNPHGANRAEKRRSSSGEMGSAPIIATSQALKSRPASRARFASAMQRAYAEGGAAQMVARNWLMASSQQKGRCRKSSGESMCAGKLLKKGNSSPPSNPMSWCSGSQETATA